MIELTEENFEEVVIKNNKPVLVDFFAKWCSPCFVLSPILEKLAEDFQGKIIFAKADLDAVPLLSQRFGIDKIPTVIFFKNGKPTDGFFGLRAEPVIKEWLENMLNENEKIEKVIEEYEDYAKKNGFKLNPNQEVVKRIIAGLLENEKKYQKRYCPCRRITGNLEEDKGKICPCYWHREEIEKNGHCLCGLFVK